MNAAQVSIINREFPRKTSDDPKVQARTAHLIQFFDVLWLSTTLLDKPLEPPETYEEGFISPEVIAWLPANCFVLLPESERPQPPRLLAPKAKAQKKRAIPKPAVDKATDERTEKRGRPNGLTYSQGLGKYNGSDTPDAKTSKVTTSTVEKAAAVQVLNDELTAAQKASGKKIRALKEEVSAAKRAAREHHLVCQNAYTKVATQALYSEGRVPAGEIDNFPAFPPVLEALPAMFPGPAGSVCMSPPRQRRRHRVGACGPPIPPRCVMF